MATSSGLRARRVTSSRAHWPAEKGPRETRALVVMGEASVLDMVDRRDNGSGRVCERYWSSMVGESHGWSYPEVSARGARYPITHKAGIVVQARAGGRCRNWQELKRRAQQQFPAQLPMYFFTLHRCLRLPSCVSACRQSFLTVGLPRHYPNAEPRMVWGCDALGLPGSTARAYVN